MQSQTIAQYIQERQKSRKKYKNLVKQILQLPFKLFSAL